MTTFASPRYARRDTPSFTPTSGFLPAVVALAERLEAAMIGALDRLEERREAAASRRLLAGFDDRGLADLGLSRADVEHL